MPDGFGAQQRSVPFLVTNPECIPTKRYYDAEFFKLESEHLWPHVWQMACRLEQIPNVGDWTEYSILGKSVLVVRTKDGVKAYHNACRHRGVRPRPRPRQLQIARFYLPVPRLALEHGRQEYFRLRQAFIQRAGARF